MGGWLQAELIATWVVGPGNPTRLHVSTCRRQDKRLISIDQLSGLRIEPYFAEKVLGPAVRRGFNPLDQLAGIWRYCPDFSGVEFFLRTEGQVQVDICQVRNIKKVD